jgi:Zn-dependent protease with chaperone function
MAQSTSKSRGDSGGNRRSRGRGRQNTRHAERPISAIAPSEMLHGPLTRIDETRRRNHRWPLLAYLGFGLVFGLIGALICLPISLVAFVPLGVLITVFVALLLSRWAPGGPGRVIGGAPVMQGQLPRVDVLLDALSTSFGVTTPDITILDDPVRNAGIFGTRMAPTIVVTTGLLTSLDLIELEGVLAHLLAHERLDAVQRGSAGAGLALLLGPMGQKATVAHRLTGRNRLWEADEVAVLTVQYPKGLAAALLKIENGPLPEAHSFFSSRYYSSLRWLFVDPSILRRSDEEIIGDLDATSVRRRALSER